MAVYGFIKIIDDTGELLREARTVKNKSTLSAWEKKYANGILRFTQKELSKMPKEFRKEFKAGNIVAHVRKKDNGVFEIRCQINKKPIRAASKQLEIAKEKFIQALSALNNPGAPVINKRVQLCDYMLEWLETVKKPAVKPVTYKEYMLSFNSYICPAFKGRELAEIKGFELQGFINRYSDQGKHRTAKKVYQLLAAVFDYAVMDEIISKSPMQKITLARYEEEHGTPLDRTEEKALISQLPAAASVYVQAYVFMLYTGVRRSELASVEVVNGWVTLITSKLAKGLKAKSRAVPVSPMLARVLPYINVKSITAISPAMLTRHIKDFFPNHHAHDLRHTFITRCQECGIQRELVSLWAGHAADTSTTSLVYTHLEQNKEHQAAEMQKFDYVLI